MAETSSFEGFEDAIFQLTSLVTAYPPPFIYMHDPMTPHLAAAAIQRALLELQGSSDLFIRCACVDAAMCFNSRLLFDTVLNALAQWTPVWDERAENWGGPSVSQPIRFNDSFDAFVHGIRALHGSSRAAACASVNGKGKARDNMVQDQQTRLVIFIERAERLKQSMPDLLIPLTRLSELSRTDVTLILSSDVNWDQLKPSWGAAPDPFYIDVGPLSKQAVIARLASAYPAASSLSDPNDSSICQDTYHPALLPLYRHFVTTLYSVCSPFTTDPDELAYIAAARWPGFVQPVLHDHKRRIEEHRASRSHAESEQDGVVADSEGEEDDREGTLELQSPSEDVRIRLTRLFTPSFTAALEALYPRLTFAAAWARANVPDADLLSIPPRQLVSLPTRMPDQQVSHGGLKGLPRMVKFILVASFIASTNPAKTDMRMFGRGPDERAKRKRRGGSPRKTSSKNTAVKVPQRLLGPIAFPLDRMIAILGVLLEENDADVRPPAPEYSIAGEYTETEISRAATFAQVTDLACAHLLYQTSPQEKLDLSSTFKCGVGYEAALDLAREIGVNLHDLLWDPQ